MERKDFIKWSSAGFLSTAFGFESKANEVRLNDQEMGLDAQAGWNGKEVISNKAMVCASQPLAVAAGYDILKAGGNAIDAAIAVERKRKKIIWAKCKRQITLQLVYQ
jgi:hypothetical protein